MPLPPFRQERQQGNLRYDTAPRFSPLLLFAAEWFSEWLLQGKNIDGAAPVALPATIRPERGAWGLKQKSRRISAALMFNWCPGGDSNSHAIRRYHLKIVCLPIPPPGHSCFCIRNTPAWQVFFSDIFLFFENRAGQPFRPRSLRAYFHRKRHVDSQKTDSDSATNFLKQPEEGPV